MGSLSDHLQSFKVQPQPIQIHGIDFIYLINLDRRPDRLARSLAQFQSYDLEFHRFSAMYGWNLSQETFNDIGLHFKASMDFTFDWQVFFDLKMTESSSVRLNASSYGKTCVHRTMSGGALGCALSHLSVLQHAYNEGYKTILILEDDVTLADDPRSLSSIIRDLDKIVYQSNWDILYTDDDHYLSPLGQHEIYIRPDQDKRQHQFEHKLIGNGLFKIGGRFQTHSMIIRRSGIEKIISKLMSVGLFRPIDVELSFVESISLYNSAMSVIHGRDREYSDTERKLL